MPTEPASTPRGLGEGDGPPPRGASSSRFLHGAPAPNFARSAPPSAPPGPHQEADRPPGRGFTLYCPRLSGGSLSMGLSPSQDTQQLYWVGGDMTLPHNTPALMA
ncbi:hypothetical protein NDU88_006035 [Pleurodeles waltl]|uniref:Uncharacterized protein n=1 Tax=Pleurodeles waltl TaxID=8319 RepID=A0AAV7TVM8_PLEWA|nr:hypothetical protein NDU88_006035 [Pleurodeles waltl]